MAAPIVYTPMEVDARKRAEKATHVRLQQPSFLTARVVSVEDTSKRAETARPQLDERCEKRRQCHGVLNVTNDENGDELNGETDDDEDMEDGEMGLDDGRDIQERRHKMTWAMLVLRKGTEFPWIAKRAAKFIDQLGHKKRATLRCDNEPEIEALAREIAQARQEGSQTVPERPPVGESQSNGIACGWARCRSGQDAEGVPPDARMLRWLVEFAAYLMNRCDIGSDGKTPLQTTHRFWSLESGSCTCPPNQREEESGSRGSKSVCWHAELTVRCSGCHGAGTGDQDKVGDHQERWQNT